MKFILLIFITIFFEKYCKGAVIPNAFLPSEKQISQTQGLYGPDDKVIALTSSNLREQIYGQNHATELEFYNSYCGFCKRFAPVYKDYAARIHGWSDIIKVCAIDCAAEDNNDLCREFEIMSYPTLRYYPPNYKTGVKQLGINVDHEPMDVGHDSLIALLMNETAAPNNWPKLQPILLTNTTAGIFDDEHTDVQYIFLINELQKKTTTAQDVALDFHKIKTLSVRQVASVEVASKHGLPLDTGLYVLKRNTTNVENIPTTAVNRTIVHEAINAYIQTNHIASIDLTVLEPNLSTSTVQADVPNIIEDIEKLQNQAIVDEVTQKRDIIYQADIEGAIKYSLFHELVQHKEFSGDSFGAMQRFVNILKKYAPLSANGRNFLTELSSFVSTSDSLIGSELATKLTELETKWHPIFSSKRWVGCQSSVTGLRGFTCGLWQLFHYLSVQAANTDQSNDPLEALHAIHGYVKHFFGCTDCSQHFQTMATKNKIWNVANKDDAILWLWSAHNEVNGRLSGDATEDPVFPKIQYPAEETCLNCRNANRPPEQNGSKDINWNRLEILLFFKRIYSPIHFSRLGVEDESILPEYMDSTRNKRHIGNVITDIDVRMGIFLYACCMGIIIVAVKLFLKRGYRKKLYMHDILGKV